MLKLKQEITKDLLKEPGHDEVFNAMTEAADTLTDELKKYGGDHMVAEKLIETTHEYDKFVFNVYLSRLGRLL